MSQTWTLDEAVEFHNRLLPVARTAGFGLGLTGGVLRNGTSNHDLDVIVYPLQAPAGDITAFKLALESFGLRLFRGREELTTGWRLKGSMDEKWVEVWMFDDKRVDVFFLR